MKWLSSAVLVVGLLSGLSDQLSAQCEGQEDQKLLASDGARGDTFGRSVSLSGDVAVIGAYHNDDLGLNSGSAYVYRFHEGSWGDEQKLLTSDGDSFDLFGWSVSVSDDVAVVGAHRDKDNGLYAGAAYVFRDLGNDFVEEQKLLPSDGLVGDRFGWSVSVWGDVAIVGAPHKPDTYNELGAAYVFRHNGNTWVEEQKLLPSDGFALDRFGTSIAIHEDVAFITSPLDDDMGDASGSVYAFRKQGNTWVEEQKILASDGFPDHFFGRSVAVSDDLAVISALGDDEYGLRSGAAYVYRYQGGAWVLEQKLLDSDGEESDWFGESVAVNGNTIVIGIASDEEVAPAGGSAMVYRYNGNSWQEQRRFLASDGSEGDVLGSSVSLDGDRVLAGADGVRDNGEDSGSAYVFTIPEIALNASPESVIADDTLTLTTCGGIPGNRAALFLMQVNGAPAPVLLGFGTFDSEGRWPVSFLVPSGLEGIQLTLQSFSRHLSGAVGSDEATVTIVSGE